MCRIGCGGVPMRVYNRVIGGRRWSMLKEYVDTPTVVWYGTGAESASDFPMLAGHWLSSLVPPHAGQMWYLDAFGVQVRGDFGRAAVPKRVPEYLEPNPEMLFPTFIMAPMSIPAICAIPCAVAGACAAAGLAYIIGCMVGCYGSPDFWRCVGQCIAKIPSWIIPRCLREAGGDWAKLLGCIWEECLKARSTLQLRCIGMHRGNSLWSRQLGVAPATLLGVIPLVGVTGTIVLWSWGMQASRSNEMSLIILIVTLWFWINVMRAVLKSLRVWLLFKDLGLRNYNLDFSFVALIILSIILLYLLILIPFMILFHIENKLLLFIFAISFLVLNISEITVEAMTRHAESLRSD